jgi:DNA-binding NtrC family response regulator
MPARVVVVHDGTEFVASVRSAVQLKNYDVVTFSDTLSALTALESAKLVDVLITGTRFRPERRAACRWR